MKRKLKRYRAAVLKAAVEGKLTEEWRKKNRPKESGQQFLSRILQERRHRWEEEQLAAYEKAGKTPPAKWKDRFGESIGPDTSKLSRGCVAGRKGSQADTSRPLTIMKTSCRGFGKHFIAGICDFHGQIRLCSNWTASSPNLRTGAGWRPACKIGVVLDPIEAVGLMGFWRRQSACKGWRRRRTRGNKAVVGGRIRQ